MTEFKEVKCKACKRLFLKTTRVYRLADADYDTEIKCTRCKAINHYKVK
ncbi:Com family DNA-binding transcriptional regulator [Lysinibacillus sp. NPDC093688]